MSSAMKLTLIFKRNSLKSIELQNVLIPNNLRVTGNELAKRIKFSNGIGKSLPPNRSTTIKEFKLRNEGNISQNFMRSLGNNCKEKYSNEFELCNLMISFYHKFFNTFDFLIYTFLHYS